MVANRHESNVVDPKIQRRCDVRSRPHFLPFDHVFDRVGVVDAIEHDQAWIALYFDRGRLDSVVTEEGDPRVWISLQHFLKDSVVEEDVAIGQPRIAVVPGASGVHRQTVFAEAVAQPVVHGESERQITGVLGEVIQAEFDGHVDGFGMAYAWLPAGAAFLEIRIRYVTCSVVVGIELLDMRILPWVVDLIHAVMKTHAVAVEHPGLGIHVGKDVQRSVFVVGAFEDVDRLRHGPGGIFGNDFADPSRSDPFDAHKPAKKMVHGKGVCLVVAAEKEADLAPLKLVRVLNEKGVESLSFKRGRRVLWHVLGFCDDEDGVGLNAFPRIHADVRSEDAAHQLGHAPSGFFRAGVPPSRPQV